MDVVLVDKDDKMVGFKEKFAAHKIPVPLHRAISIVIFNKYKTQMLITKRADGKPTWPGLWSNAVCSHPLPNETYLAAANRRLYEELGIKTELKESFHFIYSAEMPAQGEWGENELDYVFEGEYEDNINPDPEEISDCKWVKNTDLNREIKINPQNYTPWFRIILNKITKRGKIMPL